MFSNIFNVRKGYYILNVAVVVFFQEVVILAAVAVLVVQKLR